MWREKMTFEDSQKMMIVSQSVDFRHEENILWGEFRQTFGEIRADTCEIAADFEGDCARVIPRWNVTVFPRILDRLSYVHRLEKNAILIGANLAG
jgi:hypothetical protein